MPQLTFGNGYLAGWRWIRGDDQVPTVPAYSVSEGEAPFQAGVRDGLRDGCISRQKPATKSEQMKDWVDRALSRSDSVRCDRYSLTD
jgi:hypothetical protein